MSDFINDVMAAHGGLMSTFAILMLAGVIYFAFKHRIDFWVMDTWYVLPVIGRISRLAKDSTQSSRDGWLNAEKALCADYKKFIHLVKEPVFNSRIEYMKKAHDLGRTPVPAWVMLFLVGLVIAEGLGFSYMLGTWMAREGSANTHTVLMIAIVLVLCGIMVWVTHSAGHQYYRTSLLRGCFKRFKDEGGQGFFRKTIALKDDQSADDDEPDYTQCANRVSERPGDQGSYSWVAIAVIAIAAIAFLSTYMRWENLKGELIRETTAQTQSAAAGNPFANGGLALPSDVTAPQKAADDKASSEARNATQGEGMAAFIMLAFIFVVTQIVGCSAGYKYGFAGKESKGAFKETQGFSTYDAYLAHYEPLIHLAESRLQALQQQLEESSHQKLKLTKTFVDHLSASAESVNTNLRRSLNSEPAAAKPAATVAAIAADPLTEALQKLDSLGTKEEKKAFLNTLDQTLMNDVTAALKARKAEEENRLAAERAQRDAELDSLL